jgi:DNA-binding LacI/PurR family transcriptional regulator
LAAVLMDSADGMKQAVQHLAALGHERVAYLSGPRSSWSNRQRRRGLASAVAATGLEVVELGPLAPTFAAGHHAADLALATGVTAVVAFNDLMALGVISRLAERSVAVPTEMSVVSFDDIPMAAMCTPPLTSVAMPTELAGRVAVDLLLSLLRPEGAGGDRSQRRLPTQLIVRGSTAPPTTAARTSGGQRTTSAVQEGNRA